MGSSERLEELVELENAVKDAIINDAISDKILAELIRLTIMETAGGRYLFESPLKEPYFYQRYFKRWVSEGFQELEAIRKAEENHVQSLQQTKPGTQV